MVFSANLALSLTVRACWPFSPTLPSSCSARARPDWLIRPRPLTPQAGSPQVRRHSPSPTSIYWSNRQHPTCPLQPRYTTTTTTTRGAKREQWWRHRSFMWHHRQFGLLETAALTRWWQWNCILLSFPLLRVLKSVWLQPLFIPSSLGRSQIEFSFYRGRTINMFQTLPDYQRQSEHICVIYVLPTRNLDCITNTLLPLRQSYRGEVIGFQ